MLSNHQCTDCHHCTTRVFSIFHVLNIDETSYLQSQRTHILLKSGETLFHEGQYPSGFYIVTKGKIKISKTGIEGREQILRFAKEGNIVGYRISNDAYTCTATAITDLHLCFIKNEVVQHLFKKNPDLVFQFLRVLADDLKDSDSKLLHLSQKNVRERVAESLLLLSEIYGTEADGCTIDVVLKRDELAGIAGTIRETATRFLYEFKDAKLIELNGKKIKILDLEMLQKTANTAF